MTAAFHMRRALLLGGKILDGCTLDAHFANDKSTRRDNWFLTEKGRKRCFDEAVKIKELAEKGDVTPQFVSYAESGKRAMRPENLLKISSAF